jgi:hypothetical protein
MPEQQASTAEYQEPQEPEAQPKAKPPRSGYARLKRRHSYLIEMHERLQEQHDRLASDFAMLESAFDELREMHDRLLADLRRTAQTPRPRLPFAASVFGAGFNVR